MVKKLLDQPYLKAQLRANESSSLSRLKKFLEAVDKFGKTPLLYSCFFKNYATIELLAGAGADLKRSDNSGNTAIIVVVSSRSIDQVPTEKESPGLFKVKTKFYYLQKVIKVSLYA